jgi:hypothetical protein
VPLDSDDFNFAIPTNVLEMVAHIKIAVDKLNRVVSIVDYML